MGNNNSMINVTFDRPQPTIYYTGDIISGRINLTIPERTDKIHDIYLTVTGDIGYTTSRVTRMQNGQTERITDHHDVRVLEEKVFLGEAISTQQNPSGGRMNNRAYIERGEYTHPFSVRLPDNLPPTLHPSDYPFVRYELQLYIEKKWYSQNGQYRYPFRVYPRVNLLQMSNSQFAVKFDTKRNDMKVNGIIERAGLLPGETTNLLLELYNPSRITIKRIDACLIQRYEIEQCRRRLELVRFSVPQIVNRNSERMESTCPIIIPMGISPTCNYKNRHGNPRIHVNVRYDIKLEVKAKGLFSDFDVQVPITIGTDSAGSSSFSDQIKTSKLPIDLNAIDRLELQADDDPIA